MRCNSDDWKKLPISDVSPEQQAPIVALVDQILAAKRRTPNADISELERQVDAQASTIYGLVPASAASAK